jgi:hypothetical protein
MAATATFRAMLCLCMAAARRALGTPTQKAARRIKSSFAEQAPKAPLQLALPLLFRTRSEENSGSNMSRGRGEERAALSTLHGRLWLELYLYWGRRSNASHSLTHSLPISWDEGTPSLFPIPYSRTTG